MLLCTNVQEKVKTLAKMKTNTARKALFLVKVWPKKLEQLF